MDRFQVPPDVNTELNQLLNSIMDSAVSVPIILESEPTTANGLLKEGQRGFYNSFIYEVINGTCYKFTATAV